jgi:hypothetical protein
MWYRCIGNAVSPPVVALLCGSLVCALFHTASEGPACSHPGLLPALRLSLACSAHPEALRLTKVAWTPLAGSRPFHFKTTVPDDSSLLTLAETIRRLEGALHGTSLIDGEMNLRDVNV